jgi:hypothetical protein
MYLYIFLFLLCIIYFIRLSSNDNIVILMTALPPQMRKFVSEVNGTWLLIPEGFDYKNISVCQQKKCLSNYYYIGLRSHAVASTLLGQSKIISNVSSGSGAIKIDIPNLSYIKKYLNLTCNYKVTKKIKAIFYLVNLELTAYFIKDNDKTHIVEYYRYPK